MAPCYRPFRLKGWWVHSVSQWQICRETREALASSRSSVVVQESTPDLTEDADSHEWRHVWLHNLLQRSNSLQFLKHSLTGASNAASPVRAWRYWITPSLLSINRSPWTRKSSPLCKLAQLAGRRRLPEKYESASADNQRALVKLTGLSPPKTSCPDCHHVFSHDWTAWP